MRRSILQHALSSFTMYIAMGWWACISWYNHVLVMWCMPMEKSVEKSTCWDSCWFNKRNKKIMGSKLAWEENWHYFYLTIELLKTIWWRSELIVKFKCIGIQCPSFDEKLNITKYWIMQAYENQWNEVVNINSSCQFKNTT